MPRFDGTGPAGMGPMTGWGMGPCATGESGTAGVSYGRGYAYPRGGRMWYGPRFGRGRGIALAPSRSTSRQPRKRDVTADVGRRVSEALRATQLQDRRGQRLPVAAREGPDRPRGHRLHPAQPPWPLLRDALFFGGLMAFAAGFWNERASAPPSQPAAVAAPPWVASLAPTLCGPDMTFLPGGAAAPGAPPESSNAARPFCLAQRPVSTQEYQACVTSQHCEPAAAARPASHPVAWAAAGRRAATTRPKRWRANSAT